MTRNVICVGTIWDLDELVYPERDDYSDMTRRNFRQLVKFQLSSSKKEMSDVVKLPLFPRNQHGIRVRACCASCLLKEITQEGKRICTHHHCRVDALDKCRHWQMAEVLQEIGK
jgi:hypothetical protein